MLSAARKVGISNYKMCVSVGAIHDVNRYNGDMTDDGSLSGNCLREYVNSWGL